MNPIFPQLRRGLSVVLIALTACLSAGWLAVRAATEETRPLRLTQNLTAAEAVNDLITFSSKYNTVTPLLPGEHDPNITRLTAQVLAGMHYSREPFTGTMANRFLDRYIEMLDPVRIHFFQSDLAQFDKYRPRLAQVTAFRGETLAAREIFARFVQRIDQRVEYVAGLLQNGSFEFTGDDRYTPNRKTAARPANEREARELWRQHLRYEYLQEKLNDKTHDQIVKTLSARYKRLLRSWADLDNDDVLQLYLSALANAYDPHSDYMGKAQLENFAISMKLSLFGIGALLRAEDGYCKIESLMAGGPAARSRKIKPGDRIIAVAQKDQEPVDVVDMKLTKIVEMIRGPKGTEVTLTLIPADAADDAQRKVVTLIRDEIKLEDQEAKAKLIELPGPDGQPTRLGVIDLPSFYASFELNNIKDNSEQRSTSADLTRLIKKLTAEKISGLVLDLRRNGGGSLEEAIRVAGLFIKQGPIVQVRDTSGDVTVESDRDPAVAYDGPLVVLTSRFSASASEIVAAALQDYGRALVVGDTNTHGKGTVQTIYELNRVPGRFPTNVNPGALKVTIRKFYRANGESTQLRGVQPDIVLPSVANYMEVGEASLDYPLPWDTIESARFDKLDRVQPYLDELRRRTEKRQEASTDYAYIREDIEQFRRTLADRSVSLNEANRRREKEENEARRKARLTERKARPAPSETLYEITLKNAGQEGLPDPFDPNKPKSEEEQALSARTITDPDPEETEAEDEKTPAVDVALEETKRILLDLISLTAARAPVTPVASVRSVDSPVQGN
ncbi:MAG: carboxy terminal-processing peptidase [Verrucomicrobia bacterium]|nr:carboxy terminal-processing peptidase [Verrucomicrobiota bacterium]